MRFKKGKANEYVIAVKKGQIVKQGLGLSLWFNEFSTNLMVLPSQAFDGEFAFDDLVTSDYQSVCVQGSATYMISDYIKASSMLDFAYTPQVKTSNKIAETLEILESRISNTIKAIVIREVSKCDVRSVLRRADEMALTIEKSLCTDEAIAKLGVSIVSVNILGISPRAETRKALEAAAREQILKEQDDAIYKRRNAAIEQERIIKENEINTEIAVAEKERAMKRSAVQEELALEKEKQEKEFLLKEMSVQKKIEIENREMEGKIALEKQNKEFTELSSANEKIKADIKAYAVSEMVKAYSQLDARLLEACAMAKMEPGALMAKAFMNIGENAEKIGNFNMTPDLLQSIVQTNVRG